MTPEARLKLVEELLEEIAERRQPADLVSGSFLRARRYVGAKDRRAINERLWGVLRRRARLGWHLEQTGAPGDARWMVLADLALSDGLSLEEIKAFLIGGGRAMSPLREDEGEILARLCGRRLFHYDMPDWVRGEYPEWIEPRFAALYGDAMASELGALRDEAPIDLRVNLLKTDKRGALAALAKDGVSAKEGALSPWSLRLEERQALGSVAAYRDGLVEIQDEGSQLIALLSGAEPGQSVVDFCAGAGGKTLALAMTMENKGRLIALDVNEKRSEKSVPRFRRAGAHNIIRHVLKDGDKWLKRHAGRFDLALVDAPCSGTGTWRRNPDAKWRLTPNDVQELCALQKDILEKAHRLVRPGGRMVYATCSLLPEEGEEQIAGFLAAHPEFAPVSPKTVWKEKTGRDWPFDGEILRLSPLRDGTDGFFAAILERRGEAG